MILPNGTRAPESHQYPCNSPSINASSQNSSSAPTDPKHRIANSFFTHPHTHSIKLHSGA